MRPVGPNRRAPGRAPRPPALHAAAPGGVTCHALYALDQWYVVSEHGIWTVEPDRDALLAWCLAHVRTRCEDTVIIHYEDAPQEPGAPREPW